jgi:hypothetical protein
MRVLIVVVGLVLSVAVLGALPVASPPTATTYPEAVLARASAMTQQMSVTTGSAHAFHPHTGDEQLRLSADPAFLRRLEAYQADIDRMLARRP